MRRIRFNRYHFPAAAVAGALEQGGLQVRGGDRLKIYHESGRVRTLARESNFWKPRPTTKPAGLAGVSGVTAELGDCEKGPAPAVARAVDEFACDALRPATLIEREVAARNRAGRSKSLDTIPGVPARLAGALPKNG